MFTFVLVVQALVAAALIGVILMQKSEGGGLGVGGSPAGFLSARGAADFLSRATAILAAAFVGLSILLAVLAAMNNSAAKVTAESARAATTAPAAPAVPAASSAPESSVTGIAELTQKSDLYGAVPPQPSDKLTSYDAGTKVKLLGQSFRGWVKVQPAGAVMIGWMWGPSLKAVEVAGGLDTPVGSTPAGIGPQATAAATSATPPANAGSGNDPTAVPGNRAATIEQLDPEPLAASEPERPVARALRIEICTAVPKDQPACGTPLASLRVEVRLAATLAVQVQGVTDAEGKVTLSTSVPSGTRLLLSIPALGVQTDIANDATELPVRVPATLGGNQ